VTDHVCAGAQRCQRCTPSVAIASVERDAYSAMAARERPQRRLVVLLAATALCYAIGYPLALVAHSAVGWAFVALGGPLLIALGVVVIRRVHFSAAAPDRRTDLDAT
jgi:cyanate permease